jgi:hypothetical protein
VLVGGAIQRSRTPVHDRLIAEGRAVVARRERQREAVRNAKPDQEGDSLST